MIEKERLSMQDNNGKTQQHWGGSLPVRELEEGFNDWVSELRSILQTHEKPLTIPSDWRRAGEKGDQTCDMEKGRSGVDG